MHQLQTSVLNLFLILAHTILWWTVLKRNSTEIVQILHDFLVDAIEWK